MTWTVEKALSVEPIENPRRVLSEYRFRLEAIDVEVRVRIFEPVGRGRITYETSHWVHTPAQAGPYKSSCNDGDDEATALHKAVDDLVMYYREAIKAGHEPSPTWLVPNTRF